MTNNRSLESGRLKLNYISAAFFYMIIYLLFSGIVDFRIVWHILILFIGLGLLIIYPKTRKKVFGTTITIIMMLTLTIIFLSILFTYGNEPANIFSNFRAMAYSFFGLIIMSIITVKDKRVIFRFFDRHILFCNVMLFINTVVVAIQAQGTGFLIKQSWLEKNSAYMDHVAGFFGMNSTNHVGLYTVFVMLLNFSYAKRHIKKKRMLFIAYTIAMLIIMAALSRYNDNAGYFIITPMFLALYLLFDSGNYSKVTYSKLAKTFEYILVGIIFFIIFINLPAIQAVLNHYLLDRLYAMIHFKARGITGSNTRLFQIQYGLTHDFGWMLGKGFGTARLNQTFAHGFHFFGICSAGAFIILGGIWFYLIYTLLYSHLLYEILTNGKKGSGGLFAIVFLVMIAFTIYFSIYNDARGVVFLTLYCSIFNYLWEGNLNRLNGINIEVPSNGK